MAGAAGIAGVISHCAVESAFVAGVVGFVDAVGVVVVVGAVGEVVVTGGEDVVVASGDVEVDGCVVVDVVCAEDAPPESDPPQAANVLRRKAAVAEPRQKE